MVENTLEQAEKLLADPLWRLNNLYWIIDKSGNKTLFHLNQAQEQLYNDMWYCNVILKARQLGISTFVSLLFLDRCLFNSNQHAGIIAHTREDAEVMFRRVKFAYDSLPLELKAIRQVNTDNARELQLSNGSSLRELPCAQALFNISISLNSEKSAPNFQIKHVKLSRAL